MIAPHHQSTVDVTLDAWQHSGSNENKSVLHMNSVQCDPSLVLLGSFYRDWRIRGMHVQAYARNEAAYHVLFCYLHFRLEHSLNDPR